MCIRDRVCIVRSAVHPQRGEDRCPEPEGVRYAHPKTHYHAIGGSQSHAGPAHAYPLGSANPCAVYGAHSLRLSLIHIWGWRTRIPPAQDPQKASAP